MHPLALSLLLAAPITLPPARAESPPAAHAEPPLVSLNGPFDAEHRGTMGVDFALPGGGAPTVGVTYFLADHLAARVDFGLDAVLAPSGTPVTFVIAAALRFYQLRRDQVAVFLEPSFSFGRQRFTSGAVTDAAEFIGFGGAVGVEYFFTEHLAAGGRLGLGLTFNNLGGPANSSVSVGLSTGTSGLFASIYF